MDVKCVRIGWALLSVFALLVMGTPQAAGQSNPPVSKTYVVAGTSAVTQAGLNTAKEKAISDGKRIAVEQMTAELISLEVLIEQFAAIDTVIYNQADKFIQYYKVLAENRRDNTYRVLVQAKVSGEMITDRLRAAGILARAKGSTTTLSLRVAGSDHLASFVLFRGNLAGMTGVEDVQISEILPNQTTLSVAYRGTAGDFAEALVRQPKEGYTLRVFQESDNAFRIDLAPARPAPPEE